jgi:hypothetical protein
MGQKADRVLQVRDLALVTHNIWEHLSPSLLPTPSSSLDTPGDALLPTHCRPMAHCVLSGEGGLVSLKRG